MAHRCSCEQDAERLGYELGRALRHQLAKSQPKAQAKAQPTLQVSQAELQRMITTAVEKAVAQLENRPALVTNDAWLPSDDPDWGTPTRPLVTQADDGPSDDPDWS
jgi:hypothetical protein